MKALLINGSPRPHGCTYTALTELKRTRGRNMAFMMKSIQLGKAQFGLSQKEPAVFTNFHH